MWYNLIRLSTTNKVQFIIYNAKWNKLVRSSSLFWSFWSWWTLIIIIWMERKTTETQEWETSYDTQSNIWLAWKVHSYSYWASRRKMASLAFSKITKNYFIVTKSYGILQESWWKVKRKWLGGRTWYIRLIFK
jgi:hypothetical protein